MAMTGRVVLNRKAFDAMDVAIADGLFALGEEVLARVDVPDAAPFGKGLIQGGGAIAYLGNKKVNGTTIGGRQIKKPRAFKTQARQASVAVGFGFPGRFVETGTNDTRAEPFLTPTVMSVSSDTEIIEKAAGDSLRAAGFQR